MLTVFWKMKREYVLIEMCHFFEILFCPQCDVVLNFRNLALVPYYYWHDVFSGETTSAATTVFFKRIQQICHWNSKTKAQLMWMLILHICIYIKNEEEIINISKPVHTKFSNILFSFC